MHHPVLLQPAIDGLNVKTGGLYIDSTFGEGGHATEILKRGGRVLGVDLYNGQYQISNIKYQNDKAKIKNLKLICGNFKNIEKIAKENNFFPVDGILFDLGLSMTQIAGSGRGFSYRRLEEPLDMRINLNEDQIAADIVNSYNEDSLYEIFAKNSEELNSRPIASALVFARRLKKIRTVGDLVKIIDSTLKKPQEKVKRRIFQALRIEVNHEFENLKLGLKNSLKILKKDGRIVVISFHSLEDRIIKNFIRENQLNQINKKVIVGSRLVGFEQSAKLRIISFQKKS